MSRDDDEDELSKLVIGFPAMLLYTPPPPPNRTGWLGVKHQVDLLTPPPPPPPPPAFKLWS